VASEVGDSTRPDHPVSLMVVPDTLTPCETPGQGAGGINGPYKSPLGTPARDGQPPTQIDSTSRSVRKLDPFLKLYIRTRGSTLCVPNTRPTRSRCESVLVNQFPENLATSCIGSGSSIGYDAPVGAENLIRRTDRGRCTRKNVGTYRATYVP
jgi:hypothetical protein